MANAIPAHLLRHLKDFDNFRYEYIWCKLCKEPLHFSNVEDHFPICRNTENKVNAENVKKAMRYEKEYKLLFNKIMDIAAMVRMHIVPLEDGDCDECESFEVHTGRCMKHVAAFEKAVRPVANEMIAKHRLFLLEKSVPEDPPYPIVFTEANLRDPYEIDELWKTIFFAKRVEPDNENCIEMMSHGFKRDVNRIIDIQKHRLQTIQTEWDTGNRYENQDIINERNEKMLQIDIMASQNRKQQLIEEMANYLRDFENVIDVPSDRDEILRILNTPFENFKNEKVFYPRKVKKILTEAQRKSSLDERLSSVVQYIHSKGESLSSTEKNFNDLMKFYRRAVERRKTMFSAIFGSIYEKLMNLNRDILDFRRQIALFALNDDVQAESFAVHLYLKDARKTPGRTIIYGNTPMEVERAQRWFIHFYQTDTAALLNLRREADENITEAIAILDQTVMRKHEEELYRILKTRVRSAFNQITQVIYWRHLPVDREVDRFCTTLDGMVADEYLEHFLLRTFQNF